jgi:hypothetical protein
MLIQTWLQMLYAIGGLPKTAISTTEENSRMALTAAPMQSITQSRKRKKMADYKKDPVYPKFRAYMEGPFTELPETDGGFGEPRWEGFEDVAEELLFMLWKAARTDALLEAATEFDDWSRAIDTNKRRTRVIAAAMQGALTCSEIARAMAEGATHDQ